MNRSFSMLILVGFALTAIHAGSAEAKGTKAGSGRPGQSYGGPKGQKLPPVVNKKLPNGYKPIVFGQGPITHGPINGIPPVYHPPTTPVTFGGNPPRAPSHDCGDHGCRHHDCHGYWSWLCCDRCFGDSFDCYYGDYSDDCSADCDSDF